MKKANAFIKLSRQVFGLYELSDDKQLKRHARLVFPRLYEEMLSIRNELIACSEYDLPASLTCPPEEEGCEPPDIGDPPA